MTSSNNRSRVDFGQKVLFAFIVIDCMHALNPNKLKKSNLRLIKSSCISLNYFFLNPFISNPPFQVSVPPVVISFPGPCKLTC